MMWPIVVFTTSITFLISYTIAALQYPGGSLKGLDSQGFEITKNYFCDLMSTEALNGKQNLGYTWSIIALVSISTSIFFFFFGISKTSNLSNSKNKLLQFTSFVSMSSLCFIHTSLHDELLVVSILFGSISMLLLLLEILSRPREYFSGFFIFLGLSLSLYILLFYAGIGEDHHPLMQKTVILLGISWINLIAIRKLKQSTLN